MDIEKLKQLALSATPGPWYDDSEWSPDDVSVWSGKKGDSAVFLMNIGGARFVEVGVAFDANTANGQYISGANPKAILELIDRITVLESELNDTKQDCEMLSRRLSESANHVHIIESELAAANKRIAVPPTPEGWPELDKEHLIKIGIVQQMEIERLNKRIADSVGQKPVKIEFQYISQEYGHAEKRSEWGPRIKGKTGMEITRKLYANPPIPAEQEIPEGYALVPTVMTSNMRNAGRSIKIMYGYNGEDEPVVTTCSRDEIKRIWDAILSAAQEQQSQGDKHE